MTVIGNQGMISREMTQLSVCMARADRDHFEPGICRDDSDESLL